MNKPKDYELFLKSFSIPMLKAYNKNAGISLFEEAEKITKIERKEGAIKNTYIAVSIVLLLGFLATAIYNWNEQHINLIGVVVWIMIIVLVTLWIGDFLMRNDRKTKADALKKINAFEKIIQEVDPDDLGGLPIRCLEDCLREGDIKENLAKIAKKVLLSQWKLDFLKKCPYADKYDVYHMKKKERKLSERLDICIRHAQMLGIKFSRTDAIRQAKINSGVKA